MKVILLTDVKNVGKKYEIVDVAPGFGRNFLLAKELGEAVTKMNAKRVADLQKKRTIESKHQQDMLEKAFAGAKDAVISLTRNANEEGHLYAGVTAEDLALELSKVIGAEIRAEHIALEKPIKALGEFTVSAHVGEKTAQFKVVVVAAEAA
jgi:large subunit ribosomal protein L9